MATSDNEKRDWFTVFRTDEENAGWLEKELTEGHLRQGWGAPGLGLKTADGRRVDKSQWEAAHKAHWGEDPSPKRFAILTRMLELKAGDVVVVPKMPEWNQFTIARVSGPYWFEADQESDDFGHIVPIHPESIRIFGYRANKDAFLVSSLFARAHHRSPVSFCENGDQAKAAHRLLQGESCTTSKPEAELSRAAINDAFKAAAMTLRDQVKNWNGPRFEEAVRQAFRDQGYAIKDHRHFDRQGGDADILVSPPESLYRLFLPAEIAVQVKWRQGVDEDDEGSVRQIVKWAESEGSAAGKFVISSASRFTNKALKMAYENDVVLIAGLQTMSFLLGVPDRYRDDWD